MSLNHVEGNVILKSRQIKAKLLLAVEIMLIPLRRTMEVGMGHETLNAEIA